VRQLVILSGKGGTGKTTLASALISLSKARAYADCDVDAPNLHLVGADYIRREDAPYYGLPLASIDPDKCTACGACEQACRFDAVVQGPSYQINPYACEGCGVCGLVCPARAVAMKPHQAGTMTLYYGEDSVFSTAKLRMGSGTSGKLVSQVKNRLANVVGEHTDFAIIDGSPGIGCPVIATLSGACATLLVAEPSLSGLSDLERIIETARGFGVKIAVCVNKADINPVITDKIKAYCQREGLLFAGTVPYDPLAVQVVNQGMTVVDVDCPSGKAVEEIYRRIMPLLESA
jgi:MinD superfamily P-loop ATPase